MRKCTYCSQYNKPKPLKPLQPLNSSYSQLSRLQILNYHPQPTIVDLSPQFVTVRYDRLQLLRIKCKQVFQLDCNRAGVGTCHREGIFFIVVKKIIVNTKKGLGNVHPPPVVGGGGNIGSAAISTQTSATR